MVGSLRRSSLGNENWRRVWLIPDLVKSESACKSAWKRKNRTGNLHRWLKRQRNHGWQTLGDILTVLNPPLIPAWNAIIDISSVVSVCTPPKNKISPFAYRGGGRITNSNFVPVASSARVAPPAVVRRSSGTYPRVKRVLYVIIKCKLFPLLCAGP